MSQSDQEFTYILLESFQTSFDQELQLRRARLRGAGFVRAKSSSRADSYRIALAGLERFEGLLSDARKSHKDPRGFPAFRDSDGAPIPDFYEFTANGLIALLFRDAASVPPRCYVLWMFEENARGSALQAALQFTRSL